MPPLPRRVSTSPSRVRTTAWRYSATRSTTPGSTTSAAKTPTPAMTRGCTTSPASQAIAASSGRRRSATSRSLRPTCTTAACPISVPCSISTPAGGRNVEVGEYVGDGRGQRLQEPVRPRFRHDGYRTHRTAGVSSRFDRPHVRGAARIPKPVHRRPLISALESPRARHLQEITSGPCP